jgi:hypothetical protein
MSVSMKPLVAQHVAAAVADKHVTNAELDLIMSREVRPDGSPVSMGPHMNQDEWEQAQKLGRDIFLKKYTAEAGVSERLYEITRLGPDRPEPMRKPDTAWDRFKGRVAGTFGLITI